MGKIKTRVSTLVFIVLPSLTLAQPFFSKVFLALAKDDGFRKDFVSEFRKTG